MDYEVKMVRQMIADGVIPQEVAAKYFPELKESDNKRMIQYFKDLAPFDKADELYEKYGFSHKDAIAWLEKQGEKDKLIKELGEYKVKYTQEVLKKHINSMNNKDDERLRKTTIAFLKDFAKQGYENAVECIDWLEKQSEKPQGKSALEAAKEEKVDNQNCVKPADKIEPKFKVGDKIQYNKYTYTIKEVQEDCYVLDDDKVLTFNAQDVWELVEQKPAWSEVDNLMYNKIKNLLTDISLAPESRNGLFDWLKDLKDRVQPKQEWNEEDKKHIHSIISTIEYCRKENERSKVIADAYTSDLEWFKSLMNRCKPSEDLPHWKKGTLKGKNVTGFNSDFFSHNGYYINYNELFDKLPKDE